MKEEQPKQKNGHTIEMESELWAWWVLEHLINVLVSPYCLMFYYSNLSEVDYTNVYYSSNFRYEDNGINWNQFKYAIRVKAIIDAIQSQTYTYTTHTRVHTHINTRTTAPNPVETT